MAREPGSKQRRSLRRALGFIDSQCKAEFVNERKAIIGFLKRDPTLTEDELIESQEIERDHLKLQQEIQDYFRQMTKDEELEETLAEYETEVSDLRQGK